MNIVIPDQGGAKGFNSDISGFAEPLDNVCLAGKSAALYGAGGAARAVLFALQTMGIAHVTILNRTQERVRTLLTEFGMAGEALHLLAPLPAVELAVNRPALVMLGYDVLEPDLSGRSEEHR